MICIDNYYSDIIQREGKGFGTLLETVIEYKYELC